MLDLVRFILVFDIFNLIEIIPWYFNSKANIHWNSKYKFDTSAYSGALLAVMFTL